MNNSAPKLPTLLSDQHQTGVDALVKKSLQHYNSDVMSRKNDTGRRSQELESIDEDDLNLLREEVSESALSQEVSRSPKENAGCSSRSDASSRGVTDIDSLCLSPFHRKLSFQTRTGSSELLGTESWPIWDKVVSSQREAIRWHKFRRGLQEGNVRDHFTWSEDDELGVGSFGRVFRGKCCYHKSKSVAVKQLSKLSVDNIDSLWSEMQILSELDHPNILRFLEAFEDSKNFYIVTEVCLGGALDEWLSCVTGNMRFASRVALQVTGVLSHCHSKGICHRDLKLKNILLIRKSIDSAIRVADFGLAKRCSARVVSRRLEWQKARAEALGIVDRGKAAQPLTARMQNGKSQRNAGERRVSPKQADLVRLNSFAGTPEYMAPEVVRVLNMQMGSGQEQGQVRTPDFYDFRCDVWSLGVVIHTIITGEHPYDLEAMSSFVAEGMPLPDIGKGTASSSSEAFSFVRDCLIADFQRRPSAEELLHHPWLRKADKDERAAPGPEAASDLLKRLSRFASLSQFKRAALLAAARHLGAYEHEQLRGLFQKVDINHNGEVSVRELIRGLRSAPEFKEKDMDWIEEVVAKLDANKEGSIQYTEFLAAIMDHNIEDRTDLSLGAFHGFDLNGDGHVSEKEFELLGLDGCFAELREKAGSSDTGHIEFDEFLRMLRCG